MEPILGLVDGFWVSKLGNSQKLGGQGCADQIFNTFYRLELFVVKGIIVSFCGFFVIMFCSNRCFFAKGR